MCLELFLEDVELKDNTTNDNTFDIFYDMNTKEIHAFENDVENGEPRHFIYELVDDQDTIAKNHREEILEYCLATVLPTDEVGLGDIFIHGKYVRKIK
jgi:hypothetical protein